MKSNELADCFDDLVSVPVIVNTKIQTENKHGVGILTYRGIIVDKDDFMLYLGDSPKSAKYAIRWDEVYSIELFSQEDNDELLNATPGSGSRN